MMNFKRILKIWIIGVILSIVIAGLIYNFTHSFYYHSSEVRLTQNPLNLEKIKENAIQKGYDVEFKPNKFKTHFSINYKDENDTFYLLKFYRFDNINETIFDFLVYSYKDIKEKNVINNVRKILNKLNIEQNFEINIEIANRNDRIEAYNKKEITIDKALDLEKIFDTAANIKGYYPGIDFQGGDSLHIKYKKSDDVTYDINLDNRPRIYKGTYLSVSVESRGRDIPKSEHIETIKKIISSIGIPTNSLNAMKITAITEDFSGLVFVFLFISLIMLDNIFIISLTISYFISKNWNKSLKGSLIGLILPVFLIISSFMGYFHINGIIILMSALMDIPISVIFVKFY